MPIQTHWIHICIYWGAMHINTYTAITDELPSTAAGDHLCCIHMLHCFPCSKQSIFGCVLITWWWQPGGFQIQLDRMCCGDFLSFSAQHAMQALQGTVIFILPSCRTNVEAHAPYNWNVSLQWKHTVTCSWYIRSQNSTWTNRLNLIHFLLLLSHLQWSNCLVTPNATRTTGPLTN